MEEQTPMMNCTTPAPNRQSHPPTDTEWKALGVEAKSWRKMWKPTHDPSSRTPDQKSGGRTKKLSPMKGSAIFLGFLCVFLGGAAGIAHWQTGLLGVAKEPSIGKASVIFNSGFQTFYYEPGQEIWVEYSTEIDEGYFNISIWTSDRLFSWNMIEKVFEYEITHSETNQITWAVPQSGYYRIVFSSGRGSMPDFNGSFDREYSAKYGIRRVTAQVLKDPVENLNPADGTDATPQP